MANSPVKVVMCSKKGKDIATFKSAREACKKNGISSPSNIYKAIKYGLIVKGYRWRFIDQPLMDLVSYDMKNKPIVAIKDDIRKEYESIDKASKELGISISHIEQAIITGGIAKGYRFFILGEKEKDIPRRNNRKKEVVILDENNNILESFGSVNEASIYLGVIPSAVYYALNKKNKNARCKGKILRYKEDI